MSMLPEPKTSSKICRKCKEVKPLEDFYDNPDTKDGKRGSCKKCEIEYSSKRFHENPANVLFSNMKIRTKKRGWEPVEWTIQEIEERLHGCCEITGIPFETERSTSKQHMGSPYIGSPDRIDNSKGYTKENTRWVVWILNLMCGNFTDEQVKDFIKHLRNNEINL